MLDLPAVKKRCEAATDLTMWAITAREDGFCVGNGRGHNVAPHIRNQTDAEFFAHARADLLAALEALEEAQEENRLLREKVGHWVAAYSPDIVTYPSTEAVRAVNLTPEFIVGRNAMMQAIHDGLLAILGESQ